MGVINLFIKLPSGVKTYVINERLMNLIPYLESNYNYKIIQEGKRYGDDVDVVVKNEFVATNLYLVLEAMLYNNNIILEWYDDVFISILDFVAKYLVMKPVDFIKFVEKQICYRLGISENPHPEIIGLDVVTNLDTDVVNTFGEIDTLIKISKVDYINNEFYYDYAFYLIEDLRGQKLLNQDRILDLFKVETCAYIFFNNTDGRQPKPTDRQQFLSQYKNKFEKKYRTGFYIE